MRLVPTNRLLVVVGAVFIPLSIAVAFVPTGGVIAAFIALAVAAVALAGADSGVEAVFGEDPHLGYLDSAHFRGKAFLAVY